MLPLEPRMCGAEGGEAKQEWDEVRLRLNASSPHLLPPDSISASDAFLPDPADTQMRRDHGADLFFYVSAVPLLCCKVEEGVLVLSVSS